MKKRLHNVGRQRRRQHATRKGLQEMQSWRRREFRPDYQRQLAQLTAAVIERRRAVAAEMPGRQALTLAAIDTARKVWPRGSVTSKP